MKLTNEDKARGLALLVKLRPPKLRITEGMMRAAIERGSK